MDNSILKKLPTELRLHIYTFVLRQNTDLHFTYIESVHKLIRTRPLGPLQGQGLLSTCNSIRSEALPVFTQVNQLRLVTCILGHHIKLVQGEPVCSENIAAPLIVLQTWLAWSAGAGHTTTVEIDLGSWYTWWERATAEVVEASIEQLACVLRATKAKVEFLLRIEWRPTPTSSSDFEVRLSLGDGVYGRASVNARLEEEQAWVDGQPNRYFFIDNLETCRRKLDKLLSLLDE